MKKLFGYNNNIIGLLPDSLIRETKVSRIKKVLNDLVLASTSHGLPSIFRTERIFLKIMWLFFLLGSSGFGFYMIGTAVQGYLNFDVVVKIRLIKEIPTEFPTISFFFNDFFRAYTSYSLDDRLISCRFNKKPCSASDFEEITDSKTNTRYFKFNSGKNSTGQKIPQKESKLAGEANGLSIRLFIGLPEDFQNNYGFPIFITKL